LSRRVNSKSGRKEALVALLDAGREYSTAAILMHNIVAERFGLSLTELKTLDVLQRSGALTAGDISRHTHLATASVTSLIDRLEKKRLVRRSRDTGDRRRVLVKLTATLEKEIAPLFSALAKRMLKRFERYTPAETALIRDFLLRGAFEMQDEAGKLIKPANGKRRGS
jgi:DNA-binding MarR family transcriptional regulator